MYWYVFSRARIVSERGMPRIENYMYETHEMLKRAAIECMCNMVMNDKVSRGVTVFQTPPKYTDKITPHCRIKDDQDLCNL